MHPVIYPYANTWYHPVMYKPRRDGVVGSVDNILKGTTLPTNIKRGKKTVDARKQLNTVSSISLFFLI